MTPPGDAADSRGPLVRIASDIELRRTRVVDPVVGDVVSCAELAQRERQCWRDLDARYPPRDAYLLSPAERARAAAARTACRRRGWVLLRDCRAGRMRAG